MSFQHLVAKQFEEDGYFNSMLFLNLEKYNSMKKESIDSSELRLSIDLTGTPQTIQNCLSKDLLDQLDQSSPVKEHRRNDIEIDNMTLEDWTTDGSSFKNYSPRTMRTFNLSETKSKGNNKQSVGAYLRFFVGKHIYNALCKHGGFARACRGRHKHIALCFDSFFLHIGRFKCHLHSPALIFLLKPERL